MTRNEKKRMQRKGVWYDFQRHIPVLAVKLVFILLYLAGAVFVGTKQTEWRSLAEMELLSPVFKTAMEHPLLSYLLVGGMALLTILIYPFGKRTTKDQLQCIGLVNHAGMPPELLRKRRDRDNPRVSVWEFRNQSIPLQEWENKRLAIETALGITSVRVGRR